MVCGSSSSNEREITTGVPQGSVLGPLLFVVYINDLVRVFNTCKYHLFADDLVIYFESKECNFLMDEMNRELCALSEWMKCNKLKVNVTKTKSMVIGVQSLCKIFLSKCHFSIDGCTIELVETFRYLGVIIDKNLKFHDHVDFICKKVSQKLGVLRRVSECLSLYARRLIYNSIVLPHFTFCSSILYLANAGDKERLRLLQNRAMRIILGCDRYSRVTDMLRKLNWLNSNDFLEMQALIFIHKIKIKCAAPYLYNFLTKFKETHNHATRGAENFILCHKQLRSSQNSIFFKGLMRYNQLPNQLKNHNLRKFRAALKSKYMESYNNS